MKPPWADLRGTHTLRGDLTAALVTTVVAVPQSVAYASIAKLPPVMGLYAAAIPCIVGALTRSSRHVLVGPTNAVSLLVGGAAGLATGANPFVTATTLAVLVGLFQIGAGVLRLGAVVDFISRPVVLGYITGAGLLIGIGQLHKITHTQGAGGHILNRFAIWIGDLSNTSSMSVAMALGTAALIVALRKLNPKIPGPIVVLAGATALTWGLDLSPLLETVRDLEPVRSGLPPLSLPDWRIMGALLPLSIAVTVLSLMESSAVGRSIAASTGQRLEATWEFIGMGLANVASGLTGGYPVSGSLSRSALNEQTGARSRMAGVYGGLLILLVLLVLGPAVNYTPTAALAGLLLIIAWDLVDRGRIMVTMRSNWADRLTFLATMLGAWALPLDQAIYLGVTVSIIFFLRQARMLVVHPETLPEHPDVHILRLEGRLFFGVEGELRAAIDHAQPHTTLVLRLRGTQGMDVTIANTLTEAALRLSERGKRLLLTGLNPDAYALLDATGALAAIGPEQVFKPHQQWHAALDPPAHHPPEHAPLTAP